MGDDQTTIPVRFTTSGSAAWRPGMIATLRRRRVAVALLVAFTFLVGIVSQRLFASIDEGYQWSAARHPIPYIVTHDPQNHPFYGVLAHLTMQYFPGSPIAPVRLPSFIAGMLVPLVFYLTHRRWAGHEAALVVATILVVMDPLRYYMSVGRGYSLVLLGVLVLNHLVISTLRRGGWMRASVYIPVGVATCFTHLWAFPVVGTHGLFLGLVVLRRRGRGVVARRALVMLAAVAATVVIGIAAYLPMLGEIRAVAGRRGTTLMVRHVLNGVLQLPRFASWTVAAHLLFVPIILEGFARRPLRVRRNPVALMYIMTIVILIAWSSVVHSVYFGSRYLLGLVPAAAGLVAWGLSGYWRAKQARRPLPLLSRPATWAIGLALGILSANAPIAHEIPCGAITDGVGRDSGYYFRNLPRAIGDPVALGLLAVGIAALVLTGRFGGREWYLDGRDGVASAYVWTGLLLASMVPLILGPAASPPLFEVHTVVIAAVLLDAWEHRFSDRHLHALRFAFLAIAAIAVAWQANVALPQLEPRIALLLAMYLPPVLILLLLARTTGPASSDGQRP
jgi:hypothetical protein